MGYLRLMRRNETLYAVSEQTPLLSQLTNFPGVSAAMIDGVHPKGGYRVNCAITKEAFDSVIESLWRMVGYQQYNQVSGIRYQVSGIGYRLVAVIKFCDVKGSGNRAIGK